jgi:hypothetical protein
LTHFGKALVAVFLHESRFLYREKTRVEPLIRIELGREFTHSAAVPKFTYTLLRKVHSGARDYELSIHIFASRVRSLVDYWLRAADQYASASRRTVSSAKMTARAKVQPMGQKKGGNSTYYFRRDRFCPCALSIALSCRRHFHLTHAQSAINARTFT